METLKGGDKNQFEVGKSPLRAAYALLGARNPRELSNRYSEEDQKLATLATNGGFGPGAWDYKNPELITNKVKDILEAADPNSLTPDEHEWRQEILWFWYHHAISCAFAYRDKSAAQSYAAKALEYQSIPHPNKITQLLYFLVNDKLKEAEEWATTIEDEVEKPVALDLLEAYKTKGFPSDSNN